MNPTKFARDLSGASVGMAHWKWGSRRELSAGATAARSSKAFEGHLVFVETTAPVHLRLGDATVSAGTGDPVIRPGAVYAFPRARGEDFLSAVAAAGTSGATLQFWEADSYEEV